MRRGLVAELKKSHFVKINRIRKERSRIVAEITDRLLESCHVGGVYFHVTTISDPPFGQA